MNFRKFLLLFIGSSLVASAAFSQSAVSVNPVTGTANVNIPIYTVSQGQVSVPVSLNYSATGVKPKDVEGTAGMGWNLQAGGQISRQVRGLPDDVTKDNKANPVYGWMAATNPAPASISSFSILNNGSNCANETSDISYINTNFPYTYDTEPDIFYVSAPGLSCELVYDRATAAFHPVAYQDLVITCAGDASGIYSFTITNDRGVNYVFSDPEPITQTTNSGSQTYFKTKYLQYQNGITYNSTWNLTSITDAQGNGVLLDYVQQPQTFGADSVALYLGGGAAYSLQYRTLNVVTPWTLVDLRVANVNDGGGPVALSFNWTTLSGKSQTGQTILSSITGEGHNFTFTYSLVSFPSANNYTRSFLRSFSDPGAGTPINYQFAYAGETRLSTGLYTTVLPDSTSLQRDYWGYYSHVFTPGSLMPKVWMAGNISAGQPYKIYETNTGSVDTYPYYTTNAVSVIRAADPANVMAGSLNKVIYATGGSTNITYEPNDYVDISSNSSNVVVQGGGIRVKQIVDSVSTNSTNNIIRNYSYLNPATGLSSGQPISLPQYAFTIPTPINEANTNTFWNLATAISAYDLSDEDHSILYQYVKESQTGAGSTLYQYFVPAMNGAGSAPDCFGCTATEWVPTYNYQARSNCSSSYGAVTNNTFTYPFAPNPNYDFERGLPLKVTSYNDAGNEVSESNFTYQRSFSPSTITGFKFEDDVNGSLDIKSYSKYTVFYSTGELNYTVNKKVFDSANSGTSQSSTVTYTYGSANHKLLTRQAVQNSDGSTLTSNISYVKDYAATAGTNANINALYNLRQLNINAPVESYQQLTNSGSTVTTAASLTLFKGFLTGGRTFYLPSQQLKMIQPDGVPSAASPAAFSPFTINTGAQTIAPDSRYFAVSNFDAYDNTGLLQTADDTHKDTVSTIVNHLANQPVASFKNAALNEVAFSDFEPDISNTAAYSFAMTNTGSAFTATGSHAGNAYGFGVGEIATSPTLKLNPIAGNYIFSIWINAGSSSGTLTLTLTGLSTHPAIAYTGGWKYYEVKIPVGTLSSSYTVSFQTSTAVSIDDILFYPDIAEVSTATYDPVTHFKIAATNTNGVSAYFSNDAWGRLTYAYDQDHNIVQRSTYISPADIVSFNTLAIFQNGTITSNQPVAFSVTGPPATANTTVAWYFGDNTPIVYTSLSTSPTHTYSGFGPYTVSATATSPFFSTKIATKAITVQPANITMAYSSGLPTGAGSLTSVAFQQNGVTVKTFTNTQLNGGTIPQGIYTIVVTISNPTNSRTYSINLSASCWNSCQTYTASTSYSFSANLSSCTTLNFSMSPSICSAGGGGE
jgi:hypothetical protein